MNQDKLIEQYKFYRLYRMDFEQAINTLKIIRRYKKKDVRFSLLRSFVISYACPFSGNQGKLNKNHKLKVTFVPKAQRKLHNELVDLRMQLFAHTDLSFLNPKVVNWSTNEQKWFPMSFRGFDYNKLYSKRSELIDLTNSVLINLKNEIDKIEKNSN